MTREEIDEIDLGEHAEQQRGREIVVAQRHGLVVHAIQRPERECER